LPPIKFPSVFVSFGRTKRVVDEKVSLGCSDVTMVQN